jgi:hypothetical protein
MDHLPTCKPLANAPRASDFLEFLAQYARAMRAVPPTEHLSSFLGCETDTCGLQANRIDHVAVYAGDYRNDQEFDEWLDALLSRGALTNVQVGPSYIAPREYGTQGYWVSAELEGNGLELFALKQAGRWRDFCPSKKFARMSHIALSAVRSADVLPLLTRLAQCPHISILSYSPDDDLNHTYGHLLNQDTDSVLEIVHAGNVRAAASSSAV